MVDVEGREQRLLEAMVLFLEYLCPVEEGCVNSGAMSEREEAMDVLVRYGLMEWLHRAIVGRWTPAGEALRREAHRNHPHEDFEVEFLELPSPWASGSLLVEEAAATLETSTEAHLGLADRERSLLIAFLRMAEGYPRCPRAAIWALMEYGFIEKSVEEFVEEWAVNACLVTWGAQAKKFWDAGRTWQRSHGW